MNRLDFTELLADVQRELFMPGGHFEALYGNGEAIKKQTEMFAAVAITAADRYYARLTRMDFDIRERDEVHISPRIGDDHL